jgi:tRNA pseudouridine synthase 10
MEEATRKALELGLCDHCLGRLFGMKGHGMTNDQRGRALRDHFSAGGAGSEVCALCEGLFDELDTLAELVVEAFGDLEFRTFLIGNRLDQDMVDSEKAIWTELGIDCAEAMRTELNREVGKRVEVITGAEAELSTPDITAIVDVRYDSVELDVRSLFVYGRYRKMVRGIPQTRWPCRKCRGTGCDHCGGTGKMYETSVEEIVCSPLMTMTKGGEHSFHGLGREDIDVRMLGSGRPFVAEVHSPRIRTIDLDAAAGEINASGSVEVLGLAPADRKLVKAVKSLRCDKEYEAVLEVPADEDALNGAIEALRGTTIRQRTPERVSRRRADLVRERTIREISLTSSSEDVATIRILAEAGTYIKELLHGDDGRTEPSLASLLGIEVKVRELDVLDISCDPISHSNK